MALATVNACRSHDGFPSLSMQEIIEKNILEYISFPSDLLNKYQNFTEADLAALNAVGYNQDFLDLEAGVDSYVDWLLSKN